MQSRQYGTRYLALYRTTDGSQKSAGTYGTRQEAQAAYLETKATVLRGTDPNKRAQTAYPGQVGDKITLPRSLTMDRQA